MSRFALFISIMFCLGAPAALLAATGNFTVGPAKQEIFIAPGSSKSFSVSVENNLGRDVTFTISAEDLKPAIDGNLEPIKGSLKESAEIPSEIFVKAGESKNFEVKLSTDKNEEPGSHALGIFIEPRKTEGTPLAAHSRAGIIAIVRVDGEISEAGVLASVFLKDGKNLRGSGELPLVLTFANTGTTHLNPYGGIIIKNIFGREVAAQAIDPWYVMPHSERSRTMVLNPGTFFGRYTATVLLNRGYGDIIDSKTIAFFVFPKWFPLAALALLAIIALFVILRKRRNVSAALVLLLTFYALSAQAQMSSGSYRVQFDSVNFGGGLSSSASYTQESTFGEIASGDSSSANFVMHAGYQQLNQSFLSVSDAGDVTLTPNVGSISGGTANGSTAITVATDNTAGYALYVNASSSPALSSGADSFADYVPAGATPDFSFTFGSAESFFGFSPEGADVASAFLDNGASCGVGALQTTDACWDGLNTSITLISQGTSANTPAGEETTLKLRAGVGSARSQQAGAYEGDVTFSALAL